MGSGRRVWIVGARAVLVAVMLLTVACGSVGERSTGDAAASRHDEGSETTPSPDSSVVSAGNVVEVLERDGRFSIFLQLADHGPLSDPTFNNTVFVPTDDAFEELPDETLARLREEEQLAREVFRLHLTGGIQRPEEMGQWLRSGIARAAIGSVEFTVERSGFGYELVWGGAEVIEANIEADNGLIHVLGGVASAPADTDEG